jgi:hypothetical protein
VLKALLVLLVLKVYLVPKALKAQSALLVLKVL